MFPYKETLFTFVLTLADYQMDSKFDVLFLEDARRFLKKLDEKTRQKILYNIEKAKILNDPALFKKLTEDLWEFRTKYNGLQYRLIAFWDKKENAKTLVVATHGFLKKVSKVPGREIERANELRKIYQTQKSK
jgi:phage-related protein